MVSPLGNATPQEHQVERFNISRAALSKIVIFEPVGDVKMFPFWPVEANLQEEKGGINPFPNPKAELLNLPHPMATKSFYQAESLPSDQGI